MRRIYFNPAFLAVIYIILWNQNAEKDKKKFRSIKREKRRGFYGKRPHEKSHTFDDENATDNGPSTSATTSTNNTESITSMKLLNTSFNSFDEKKGMLTRELAKDVGLVPKSVVENATGFKLQDATLLSECISKVAICSLCRKSGSKLQLFQRNDKRDGLSECPFLKCSLCGVETSLSTSKRLGGGHGGGAHEVNRRAVLASTQFGHAGLSQFCAGMNLPPPVTKTCYNEHLINIEKAATRNAEEIMVESAERLRQKIASEQPERMDKFGDNNVACVGAEERSFLKNWCNICYIG